MSAVTAHYENLLAAVYGWSLGNPGEVWRKAKDEINGLGLPHASGEVADLGAGIGQHAVALADAGYRVHAFDTSERLVSELWSRVEGQPVHVYQSDLLAFRNHAAGPLDAVLCMGDTLTHLPDRAAVERLIADAADALSPGGIFCATFRDYTAALEGDARFIPVRGDENRTLTCFLGYAPETVTVHDLLHERGPDGWTFKASGYPKLRLDPAWVAGRMGAAGLAVTREPGYGGMVRLAGRNR